MVSKSHYCFFVVKFIFIITTLLKTIKNRHCSKIACNADFPLFYAVSKDFKRQEKSLQITRDKKWLVTN